MKKKLYIGCALTTLPEDKKAVFLKMVVDIKKELSQFYEILEFKGIDDLLTDKPFTPQEVYGYDIRECLMKADYFMAICDYPALGLGYELGTAVEKMGIPVLAVAHKGSNVSRAIRGIDHPNFTFAYYNSLEDIIAKTKATLTK